MEFRRFVPFVRTVLAIAAAQGLLVAVFLRVERARHDRAALVSSEQLAPVTAPDLRLVGPDGSESRLRELRGAPVLLHFWATWCGPCKQELPGLLELSRTLPASRVRVVALSVDDDWDEVRGFFGGSVPAQVARDETGQAARAFEVAALPDTYLIRADGTLGARFAGARDWRSDAMRSTLIAALEQGSTK